MLIDGKTHCRHRDRRHQNPHAPQDFPKISALFRHSQNIVHRPCKFKKNGNLQFDSLKQMVRHKSRRMFEAKFRQKPLLRNHLPPCKHFLHFTYPLHFLRLDNSPPVVCTTKRTPHFGSSARCAALSPEFCRFSYRKPYPHHGQKITCGK